MDRSIPQPAGHALPALAENRALRFTAIVLLYFMQGVPIGLTTIAVPAWLAAKGTSPIVVGGYVGGALLPWSLKLVNGLLMDRFTYRPMGRRRAWILAAQAMMVVTLCALAVFSPQAGEIALLTALGFALNLCATFNDVAVDGMTIDIVPEHERTMINSLMFGAQSLGVAATGYIAGQLLVTDNVYGTGITLAAFVAAASLFVGLLRERPGEKLVPWTGGRASAECEALQHDAWRPILGGVFRSLAQPTTVFFLLATFVAQASFAFTDAVAPTLAVQLLGWGSDEYSSFASAISIAAALAGIVLTPSIIKAVGLRNAAIALLAVLVLAGLFAGTVPDAWQGDALFQAVYAILYVVSIVLTIVLIVWAMRICDPAVAASQFALFMAVPNFGRSLLSGASGWLVESGGYALAYHAVALCSLAAIALCVLGRIGVHKPVPAEAVPA